MIQRHANWKRKSGIEFVGFNEVAYRRLDVFTGSRRDIGGEVRQEGVGGEVRQGGVGGEVGQGGVGGEVRQGGVGGEVRQGG